VTDPPIAPPPRDVIEAIVAAALDEDRAAYDITTLSTVPPDQPGEASVLFKAPGIVCGLEVMAAAFGRMSAAIALDVRHPDGAFVEAGTVVAEVRGPLAAMLSAERVALNLLQRMSGVATMSWRYVEAARRGGPARVVDTRKTTPGLRALERYAVRVGGAHNHRNTLEDGVLVKDNHVEAARRRGVALADLVTGIRARVPHTVRVEIEADTTELAREAMAAGADIVMLDNMSPDTMRAIVGEARGDPSTAHVIFEASGGITLDTIDAVAASGVDLISVGALTHSAPALDISLDVRPA
jgi:nicotinate-nucleotide pyrophosphorylase (carboxylating)